LRRIFRIDCKGKPEKNSVLKRHSVVITQDWLIFLKSLVTLGFPEFRILLKWVVVHIVFHMEGRLLIQHLVKEEIETGKDTEKQDGNDLQGISYGALFYLMSHNKHF